MSNGFSVWLEERRGARRLPKDKTHPSGMKTELLNRSARTSELDERSLTEEDYYLKSITDDDLKVVKKESNGLRNRCTYILQSLEGKTVQITALNVDIVNSSEKVKTLSNEVAGEYYQAFLESASDMIQQYGGFVLKNVGDCVIGFFPCSKYYTENHDKAVMCGLAMRDMINGSLNPYFMERKLPSIECRVSADFGPAKVIRITSNGDYSTIDLFGRPMNSAAKISRYARPGEMVIGDSLFWQLINTKDFDFKLVHHWDLIGRKTYPVYVVERRT